MIRVRKRKVVVVTGASAGVGRAIVREFAKDGAKLGLLARGVEGLHATRLEVEELGCQALALPTDVADAAQVEKAAQAVEERLGPIDIWINNAMVSVFSPVKEMTVEEYRRVTEVTYLGYVHGTLSALKRMLPRDRGLIVQIGSALAFRSIPLQSAYCAAKHAVKGFTESLRTELLHDRSNVKIAMVHLPAVNTPQFEWVKSRLEHRAQPVPPIYQPELIARAVFRMSKRPRRDVYLGASTLLAVTGEKLSPRFADWYLARNGYSSQQTDEPEDPARPHNLWSPLAGDHGARGRFSARARDSSAFIWSATHRGLLAWLAVAGVGIAAALAGRLTAARGRAPRRPEDVPWSVPTTFSREQLLARENPDGRVIPPGLTVPPEIG